MIRKFLDLCSEDGVPIADEKTEWATTRVVFLGLLLDGVLMILCIPEQKRQKAIKLLQTLLDNNNNNNNNNNLFTI